MKMKKREKKKRSTFFIREKNEQKAEEQQVHASSGQEVREKTSLEAKKLPSQKLTNSGQATEEEFFVQGREKELSFTLSSWLKLAKKSLAYYYGVEEERAAALLPTILQNEWKLNRQQAVLYGNRSLHLCYEKIGRDEEAYFRLWESIRKAFPLAYHYGTSRFMGYEIFCQQGVLIPRTDSEILVEEAQVLLEAKLENYVRKQVLQKKEHKLRESSTSLASLAPKEDGLRVLELATGTACLSIALWKELEQAFEARGFCLADQFRKQKELQWVLGDISEEAVKIAEKNLKKFSLHTYMSLYLSDLFTQLPPMSYDLIFANPPYIARSEMKWMDKSVYQYEPPLALFAEDDGLAFYQAFFTALLPYVKKGSDILLELGFQQAERLEKRMKEETFAWKKHFHYSYRFRKDYAGHVRVLHIHLF